jgi:hypothetical protein
MAYRTGRFPRPVPLRALLGLVVCAFGAAVVLAGVGSGSAAAAGPQSFVLYSVTQQEQFVNNLDDRTRGEGHNPFGSYTDVSPTNVPESKGPFAGDEGVFSFNLYKDADLKKRAGDAVYVCQYNFDKNAFCDVSFQLQGGTLIAEGAFNFDSASFTLGITGSYGNYQTWAGEVRATPAAHHAQRLSFTLS